MRVARHLASWWVVQADDKKTRLNCITHLLDQLPYCKILHPLVKLPARVRNPDNSRRLMRDIMCVPEIYSRRQVNKSQCGAPNIGGTEDCTLNDSRHITAATCLATKSLALQRSQRPVVAR